MSAKKVHDRFTILDKKDGITTIQHHIHVDKLIHLDDKNVDLLLNGDFTLIPQIGPGKMYRLYSKSYNDYLHRLITNAGASDFVDHIDNNPLNNTSNNLRITTNQQNSWNKRGHSDSKFSKYKGVSMRICKNYRRQKPWIAQIKAGDITRLKYFKSEVEAAIQYNEWAKELHGEFANLNKIEGWEGSLILGKKGEDFFYENYKNFLNKSDDLRWDFTTKSGLKIDLKCDQYPSHATKNIFVETIANTNKKSKGGPYKSAQDGVDLFVYMFQDTKEVYCFRPSELIDVVEKESSNLFIRTVRNKTYNTQGYAIPKVKVLDIAIDINSIFDMETKNET